MRPCGAKAAKREKEAGIPKSRMFEASTEAQSALMAPLGVRRRRLRSRRRLRLCPHRRPRAPSLVHLGVRHRRLRSRRRLLLCPHRRPRSPALVQQAVAGGHCRQRRPRQRRLLPLGP